MGVTEADQAANRSADLFVSGYYCAESVLLAVAEAKGIKNELLPGVATGFCSGLGRLGGMCGAVSGAIMAIGLLRGRKTPDDSPEAAYRAVRQLIEQFELEFGSVTCRSLIGCDLLSDEGQRRFEDFHLIIKCREFTQEAARMAMQILSE